MSAPLLESCHANPVLIASWTWIMPFTILGASLIGSWHCAGMCSGIVMLCSQSRLEKMFYHLGRWMSYATLGMVGGFFGSVVWTGHGSDFYEKTSWFATIGFFLILLIMGGRLLWPKRNQLNFVHAWIAPLVQFFRQNLNRLPGRKSRALAGGVLTATLPCGWLYSFVLAAASTGSVIKGVLVMSAFWAGTVPALAILGIGTRKFVAKMEASQPRLAGVVLIIAAVVTIVFRMFIT